MIGKVLVIGGHGMLGLPVTRQLVKENFSVRAFVRDIGKVKNIFPETVEIIKGDLQDLSTLKTAVDGIDAVYLNLSTDNPKAVFKAELDGTKNVIKALTDKPEVLIAKISGMSCYKAPDKLWLDAQQKYEAEAEIIKSGHPYLIFRPTWFMESLHLMVEKGKFRILGDPQPLYWIAGDDYAKMVTSAFRKGIKNKIYAVQGKEALSMRQAAQKYVEVIDKSIKIVRIPLWMVKIISWFKPEMSTIYHLVKEITENPEKFISKEAWEELYEPKITVEEFVYKIIDKSR